MKMKWMVVTGLFVLVGGLPVFGAEWNPEEMEDIVYALKKGERIEKTLTIPKVNRQVVVFRVGEVSYVVDIRAKLCFARFKRGGLTLVSCKALKNGYPLMAPALKWAKK